MRAVRSIDRFRGMYGPHGDNDGVLSDHLGSIEEAGGSVRTSRTGAQWAGFKGEPFLRVLCSELVGGWDGDGVPMIARCGSPVVDGTPWCGSHKLAEADEMDLTCEHGLAQWLCAGPGHYPAD